MSFVLNHSTMTVKTGKSSDGRDRVLWGGEELSCALLVM